jgi:hypothetical protein
MTQKAVASLLVLLALGLTACDDSPSQKSVAEAASPLPLVPEARQAAEEQVRQRLRILGEMQTRAVHVWRQQTPDLVAVCGQVNPTGVSGEAFIPWVATVLIREGRAVRTDLVLGASNADASRVYVEMLDRCFDGGGPSATARPQAPRVLPPLPLDGTLTPQAARPSAAPTSGAVHLQAPPREEPPATPPRQQPLPIGTLVSEERQRVTTTSVHPVNIRSAPAGSGAVVRIVPRSSVLQVFAEAPGGWLEVGEDRPFGWLHGSMIERRP